MRQAECGLLSVDHQGAPHQLPQGALLRARQPGNDTLDQALGSGVIRRYAEICSAFLERSRSVSTHQMVHCLQSRARKVGARTRACVSGSHIRDLAAKATLGPWQQTYFPDLAAKRPGIFVDSLDRTYSSRRVAYPTTAYALALAVLYDSAQDAFADLACVSALDELLPITADHDSTSASANRTCRALAAGERGDRGSRLRVALQEFLDGKTVASDCTNSGVDRAAFEDLLLSAFLRERAGIT